MASWSPLATPRLGESAETFADRLGSPLHAMIVPGGILRQYRWRSGVLSVLFTDDASVALHCSYAASQRAGGVLVSSVAEFRPLDATRSKLVCGTTGWMIAMRSCRLAFLDVLDRSATGLWAEPA